MKGRKNTAVPAEHFLVSSFWIFIRLPLRRTLQGSVRYGAFPLAYKFPHQGYIEKLHLQNAPYRNPAERSIPETRSVQVETDTAAI
ncbi:MAG: hypothetical protein JST06_08535 [Bacteroidetes bacterium]|nr:hypothetical protein [Bacteroidota bacterium]